MEILLMAIWTWITTPAFKGLIDAIIALFSDAA